MFGSSGGAAAAVKSPATAPIAEPRAPSRARASTRRGSRRAGSRPGSAPRPGARARASCTGRAHHKSASRTSVTARIPASCFETATPPRSQALVGNGRLGGNERTSAFQIQFERPPRRMKSPIVRMTPLITRLPLDRAHDDPLERDPAHERDQERQRERAPVADAVVDERPGDEGRERGHLALGEVHDAGRAVDDHDREREQGVDRARRRDPRRPVAGTRSNQYPR